MILDETKKKASWPVLRHNFHICKQGLWKIQIITVIKTTDIFVQSQAWEPKEYNIPVLNYALILPV